MNPNPPAYTMSAPNDADTAPYGPPRWSALAVTAFVLSFIGFLGFTAILGIIFGVVGIVVTGGGRRRGRGLAIAAIPISIVTGLIGAFLLIGIVWVVKMNAVTRQVEMVLAATGDSAKATDDLLANSSHSFQEKVSRQRLTEWLNEVHRKHGTLTSLEQRMTGNSFAAESEKAVWSLPAKFTNGSAMVRVHFQQQSLTTPLVDDIDVDGVSPRPDTTGEKSD